MSASPTQKIGLYGGTFDPIHHGHLILARDALETLGLDRLIFIPAAVSPHKSASQPGAPGTARLEMLAAAIAGEERFSLDDCELCRAGPSFTVDTVADLRSQLPADAELFYLIGEDNVAALHTWHRIHALRAMVRFAVFRRGQTLTSPPPAAAASIATEGPAAAAAAGNVAGSTVDMPVAADSAIPAVDAPAPAHAPPRQTGWSLVDPGLPRLRRAVDISSTEIRKRVATGRSIRYLVPESVASLIAARRLYLPALPPPPQPIPSFWK